MNPQSDTEQYLALLRGINVGGNATVPMKELSALFMDLGFSRVKTYINSGNVLFSCQSRTTTELQVQIEHALQNHFGFAISTLVRTMTSVNTIASSAPESWKNDQRYKTDVLFLWDGLESAATISSLGLNPQIEEYMLFPGAIVWHIPRSNITKSKLLRIVGTPLYKQMTVRNINTVRKISVLAQTISPDPALVIPTLNSP